jgi:hypothetical protein
MASKDTDLAEASQALFCAMADFVGIANLKTFFDVNTFKTYDQFKANWQKNKLTKSTPIETLYNKYIKAGKTTFKDIENFLTYGQSVRLAESWFKSSMLISTTLIKDIHNISSKFSYVTTASWKSILYGYAHQDAVIMNNIQKLFSEANKNQKVLKVNKSAGEVPFGDINKWCPADIYLASNSAKKDIENLVRNIKGLTFIKLNKFIGDLIKNGQLLPLSLKKTTTTAKLVKVNFNRSVEEKLINKVAYGGTKPTTFAKWTVTNQVARDLKVFLSLDKQDFIFFRHDPSGDSYGTFRAEVQLKGAAARAGGLGEGQIISILKLSAGRSDHAIKFSAKLTKAKAEFLKAKKPIREKYVKMGKRESDRKEYDRKIAQLSAELVTNMVMPILFDFLSNKARAQEFTRWIFQYCTSRQINSSKFVIAK